MFCEKAISEKNHLPSQLQSMQYGENLIIVVATEDNLMDIPFEKTNVVFFAMQSVSLMHVAKFYHTFGI